MSTIAEEPHKDISFLIRVRLGFVIFHVVGGVLKQIVDKATL